MVEEQRSQATVEADTSWAIVLPLVITLLYGVYLIWSVGRPDGFPHPYVVAGGALASILATIAYTRSVFGSGKPSVGGMLSGFGGMIVYVFAIYVMAYLGAYRIYQTVVGEFSFLTLAAGLIWIVLGYRILYAFWQLTEIGAKKG